MLKDHGIAISMDGKGCWMDNVIVERLWHSVKYADVYCVPTKRPPNCVRDWLATLNSITPGAVTAPRTEAPPDAVCFDQATHTLAAWHPGRSHLRQHPSFRVHFLDLY